MPRRRRNIEHFEIDETKINGITDNYKFEVVTNTEENNGIPYNVQVWREEYKNGKQGWIYSGTGKFCQTEEEVEQYKSEFREAERKRIEEKRLKQDASQKWYREQEEIKRIQEEMKRDLEENPSELNIEPVEVKKEINEIKKPHEETKENLPPISKTETINNQTQANQKETITLPHNTRNNDERQYANFIRQQYNLEKGNNKEERKHQYTDQKIITKEEVKESQRKAQESVINKVKTETMASSEEIKQTVMLDENTRQTIRQMEEKIRSLEEQLKQQKNMAQQPTNKTPEEKILSNNEMKEFTEKNKQKILEHLIQEKNPVRIMEINPESKEVLISLNPSMTINNKTARYAGVSMVVPFEGSFDNAKDMAQFQNYLSKLGQNMDTNPQLQESLQYAMANSVANGAPGNLTDKTVPKNVQQEIQTFMDTMKKNKKQIDMDFEKKVTQNRNQLEKQKEAQTNKLNQLKRYENYINSSFYRRWKDKLLNSKERTTRQRQIEYLTRQVLQMEKQTSTLYLTTVQEDKNSMHLISETQSALRNYHNNKERGIEEYSLIKKYKTQERNQEQKEIEMQRKEERKREEKNKKIAGRG